jgi:ribosomal protein S18 acetylase RimI-like enzyme
MPRIEIRPAIIEDIPKITEIDHNYHTDLVWQLDIVRDDRYIGVNFHENRLPRSVKVEYPRVPRQLMKDWIHRDALLVALIDNQPVAYISVSTDLAPSSAWITDLAVKPTCRRQGIGSALVMAAEEWSLGHNLRRIIVDMQTKNIPANRLFGKMGFEFCGYNDHFYSNQDIAIFFSHYLI